MELECVDMFCGACGTASPKDPNTDYDSDSNRRRGRGRSRTPRPSVNASFDERSYTSNNSSTYMIETRPSKFDRHYLIPPLPHHESLPVSTTEPVAIVPRRKSSRRKVNVPTKEDMEVEESRIPNDVDRRERAEIGREVLDSDKGGKSKKNKKSKRQNRIKEIFRKHRIKRGNSSVGKETEHQSDRR